MNDEITFPVRTGSSAAYHTVVDAEDRLLAFVTQTVRSRRIAERISAALNESEQRRISDEAMQEMADQAQKIAL